MGLAVRAGGEGEAALEEGVHVDVVEGGHDEVGAGGAEQVLVVGARDPERSHAARACGRDPRYGVLDHEAVWAAGRALLQR